MLSKRKIFLNFILILMSCVSLWAQTDPSSDSSAQTPAVQQTVQPTMQTTQAASVTNFPDIYKPMIGPIIGLGASWQHSTSLSGGEISPKFAIQFGARGLFRFSENTGIRADLGFNILSTRDANSTTTRDYSLTYLYLDIAPYLTFKNFCFSSGIYFGFLLKANFTENGIEDSSKRFYTTPDIGLTLGVGYLFRLNHFMNLLVNLTIKYQLSHFRKDDAGLKSGKIFSIFLDVSLLFEL